MDASDDIRTALARALESSSFTPASLGRAINRGPDYVRDFLTGRKQSLGATAIIEIERRLGLAPGALLTSGGDRDVGAMDLGHPPEPNVRPAQDTPSLRGLARTRGPKVPVLGIAVGGSEGDFQFNGQTVNWLPRPAAIADARDIYALYVSNDSMRPLYKSGDPIYVDPHRVPSIGDCVVIEMRPADDGTPGSGFVKQLLRRKGSEVVVEQFNPPGEITFKMADVKAVHRVIPWRELLGL